MVSKTSKALRSPVMDSTRAITPCTPPSSSRVSRASHRCMMSSSSFMPIESQNPTACRSRMRYGVGDRSQTRVRCSRSIGSPYASISPLSRMTTALEKRPDDTPSIALPVASGDMSTSLWISGKAAPRKCCRSRAFSNGRLLLCCQTHRVAERRRHRRRSALALPALGRPAPDEVDAFLDLLGGRLRDGRPAAGSAQLGVDDTVGLAGAVVPGADQAVELAPQLGDAFVRGQGLLGLGGLLALGGLLLGLAFTQERGHLVGLQQAGQADEVLLLGGADLGAGAELAAV